MNIIVLTFIYVYATVCGAKRLDSIFKSSGDEFYFNRNIAAISGSKFFCSENMRGVPISSDGVELQNSNFLIDGQGDMESPPL